MGEYGNEQTSNHQKERGGERYDNMEMTRDLIPTHRELDERLQDSGMNRESLRTQGKVSDIWMIWE